MHQNNITIPKPCHQNWDKMTPNEQGRFCNSCAKTVVDATHLTNDAIWEKHKQNNNSLCVHIPSNRVTAFPKNRFYQWKLALVAAAIGFWLTIKQAVYAQTDTTINNNNKLPSDSNEVIQKMVVNGTVNDSIDKLNPLAFCNIALLQNNKVIGGGISDFEGKFTITLSGNFKTKEKLLIKCSAIGYNTIQTEFTPKDSFDIDIYMNESHICLNEAVITMRRDSYIVGKLPMTRGVMISERKGKIRRKLLNEYDTKTYYSDEIERYNLGR